VITAFNPDTGATKRCKVGINPNAIAYNFQTGTNPHGEFTEHTISIVIRDLCDQSNLGIAPHRNWPAPSNLYEPGLIADQANNG